MKSISNIIKNADIFTKTIHFRYGKKDSYETFVGGLTSLGLLALLIYLLYSISYERINHLNPNLSSLPGYNIDNELYIKNTSAHIIIIPYVDFGVNNRSYTFESKSVQIVVEKATYENLKNGTQLRTWERVPLKPCDINDFDEDVQKVFYSAKLNYGLCLADRNITIKGVFESDVYKFLKINIMECNFYSLRYDSSQECKPTSETLKNLNKIKYSLYLSYSQIDANNYKKPFYSIFYNEQILLLNSTFKRKNYFLSPNVISTDNDLFYNSYTNNQTYASMGNIDEDVAASTDLGLTFFTGFLRVYARYDLTLRSYKKVPTILAEAGSLISYLNFIFIYLIGYYNEKKFELSLINHLSSYDDRHKMKNKSNDRRGVKHEIEMKALEELPKKDQTDSNLNQTVPSFEKTVINKTSLHRSGKPPIIRFSISNFLFSGCKKKFRNYEKLLKMRFMIERFLDIKNFINMNQEFIILRDTINNTDKKNSQTNKLKRNKNSFAQDLITDYPIIRENSFAFLKKSKNK
jgi:hypothetical protein